jgi:hypothetical protein
VNRIAIGTVVARNYLAFAKVLARSLAERHPEIPFFVALSDGPHPATDGLARQIVQLEALGIPDLECLCRRRSRKELAVSAKPFLLGHLLDRGYTAALFLDPDTLVVGDLSPTLDEVLAHAIVLTPHVLTPPGGADRVCRELDLLQAGTFNAGFVGVSNRAGARRMLAWWQDRVLAACAEDVSAGVYFDQRWLDLMQVVFDEVRILRDPGCNIAYWNLPERRVEVRGNELFVGGGAARFFHFSGFDPAGLPFLSRHSRRATLESAGAARVVYERYATLLNAAGYDAISRLPYAYQIEDSLIED